MTNEKDDTTQEFKVPSPEELLRNDPAATQPLQEERRGRVEEMHALTEAFREKLGDRMFFDMHGGLTYEFSAVIIKDGKPVIELRASGVNPKDEGGGVITVDEEVFKFNPNVGTGKEGVDTESEYLSDRFKLVTPKS